MRVFIVALFLLASMPGLAVADQAAPEPLREQEAPSQEPAEQENEAGKKRFNAYDYEGAARHFRRAFTLSPEARYAFNLCLALDATADYVQALSACQVVLDDENADAALKDKARQRIARIERAQAAQRGATETGSAWVLGVGAGPGLYGGGFIASTTLHVSGYVGWAPAPESPWMLQLHVGYATGESTRFNTERDATITTLGPGAGLRTQITSRVSLRGSAGIEVALLSDEETGQNALNVPLSVGFAYAITPAFVVAADLRFDLIVPLGDNQVAGGKNGQMASVLLTLEYRFGGSRSIKSELQ
jgi:hypothetical protein